MRTWIIYTRSGSEYKLTRDKTDAWQFKASSAEGKGARLLGRQFPIHLPEFPQVGERMVVYGADATFPASSGWLSTSRVTRVEEVL